MIMKKVGLALISILAYINFGYGQTTIYSENFDGQNGKGAVGPSSIVNTTEVTWSIDVSSATLSNTNDYFQVVGDIFDARDLDGVSIWYSPILDISAFTNVQFSLDASESNQLEVSDTYVTEYRINGGAWTIASNNGNLSDDFTSLVVSETGLTGNTLELRVSMNINAGSERMFLDNVLVEGTAPISTIIIANPSTASGIGYVEGDASLLEQPFSIQGFGLTADIILTAPTNFEISTTPGTGFGNSVTLTPTTGTVSLTTIYTKLISGLTVNTYNGNITATSTGATSITIAAAGEVTTPITACSELIISEYHESAPGNNAERYIELYNPTNTTIDLTNYRLANYRNGNTIPFSTNLTGSVGPYSAFLIARNTASLCLDGTADLCITGNTTNFNGNDAIALQTFGGANIDVIGLIGSTVNFASNIVLRRNPDIQIPTVAYDASQWTSSASNDITKLGSHISDCECTTTVTWDGSTWSPSAPDTTTAAILTGNYDASIGDFTSCSLTINSGVTLNIPNNTYIEVKNNVSNNGVITISPNGSFIQNNDSASFINAINDNSRITKETAPINQWYEYTYWSSPVSGETIGDTFFATNADRRYLFNAENYKDSFAETNNDNTAVAGQDDVDDNFNDWQLTAAADVMQPGVGYAATLSPASFVFAGVGYAHIFEGPFNNGVYQVPIYRNDAETADTNWNFVGNPYPSAIDIDAFFTQNNYDAMTSLGSIDGAIYLWSQNTAPSDNTNGNSNQNFTTSDYATINGSGEIAGGDGVVPNRSIPSGQGFFLSYNNNGEVVSSSTNGDGDTISEGEVIFRNSMRVTGNNNQFFRSTNNIENNKLWLNLTSDNGIFSQILIAYLDGATNGNDGAFYDARRNISTGMAAFMYSTINGDDNVFSIQGKASESISVNEIINLGLYTTITDPTLYTISIAQFEGDFFSNNTVYLIDNVMNTTHNLSNDDYTFTSDTGDFNNRFQIVFNTNTLSIDTFELNTNSVSIIELENDIIQFTVPNHLTIASIKIYDTLGRQLYNGNETSNTNIEIINLSSLKSNMFIAKVELSNGQTISKKAIKK